MSKPVSISVEGERILPMCREAVWAHLNDSSILEACIPGCDHVERQNESRFNAQFNLRVGPLKRQYVADLTVQEVNVPEHYILKSDVTSGTFGQFNGGADVFLYEEKQDATKLVYRATIDAKGWFAEKGLVLLEGVFEKVMRRFFDRFEKETMGSKILS